jgi:DNA invertase Pin-like site-specific DNA recombinase
MPAGSERQRDGIEKAKERGCYRGRSAKFDPEAVAKLSASGIGTTAIAKQIGASRASIYRL